MKITVIGSGGWGTALAVLLHKNGHQVTIWSFAQSEIDYLNEHHENALLKGVRIPEEIGLTADIAQAEEADLVVSAVPSFAVRQTAEKLRDHLREDAILVSVTKGIERGTAKRMSEILAEVTGHTVAVLSGPTHAEEVGREIPTGCVVACPDEKIAETVQDVFMSPVFRVYTSPDTLGMEIGAALKNVVALAAGMADGLGYGDNTKAALITRGIAEISRLGTAAGGRAETFQGLTGIGDLIVTCASMHSRNRRAGILIGQGKTADEAMKEVKQVVEGVYSAKAAKQMAQKYGAETPIIDQVCAILFEGKPAREAVSDLMLRDKKMESHSQDWEK